MLLVELLGDPDHDLGLQAGQVGEDLAQVLQVCIFQLVLDEHASAICRLVGNDVGAVGAHVDFATLKLQIDSDHA